MGWTCKCVMSAERCLGMKTKLWVITLLTPSLLFVGFWSVDTIGCLMELVWQARDLNLVSLWTLSALCFTFKSTEGKNLTHSYFRFLGSKLGLSLLSILLDVCWLTCQCGKNQEILRKYNRCSHSSIHPYSSTYPYQCVRYELGWSKPICLLISLRGLQEYFFSLYGGHSRGRLWMLQFESILAFFSYFPSNGFLTASFPLKTLLLMPWQTMGDAFPRSCDGSMLHFFLLLEDMIFKRYLSALEFFLGILLSSPFPVSSIFFKTHFMPC